MNGKQSNAIRWIVEHRSDHYGYLERDAVIESCQLSPDEYDRLLLLLSRGGAVDITKVDNGNYASHFRVLEPILDLAYQLDNQPLPDYRVKIEKWFYSKWWSVPVRLIFVGLPAIVGYVIMLQTF